MPARGVGGILMHWMSRRAVLAGGLAAMAGVGAAPLLAADPSEQPLKDIAGARGLR